MKVNENKQIALTETDVDKLLLHRLKQIQSFLEDETEDIQSRHKSEADIILFPNGKKEADIRKLMTDMILDYLKGLVDKNEANMTLRKIYHQLRNKEVELGLVGEKDKYDWLKAFSTHISQLDHYAKQSVKAIQNDKHYSPTNTKVISLLRTYDSLTTDERIHRSMAATHWEKFFNKYCKTKQNLKGTSKERLDKMKYLIQLVFLLLDKEYIEDITIQDCRKLCELIYRVPKHWTQKIKDASSIHSILTDNPKLALSRTTIQDYLSAFKEFMRYAVKEEIIQNSLNEFIDIPVRKSDNTRNPFIEKELHKIFNPITYPNPQNRTNMARFWIPIIALYHGCRQNEICQLDVDDIVRKKGIPCISINDNGEDKSVKNKGSIRVIPIHPKILDMGFLSYVNYQRRRSQKKLFSSLKRQGHNGYGSQIQHWFGRYLDSINITGKDKVFHSFRHTFETMAVEKKIPSEYQNAICGWTDSGIGQRIYGRKKDIVVMKDEISKITYPINREMNALKKEFLSSYVMKD